MCSWLFMWSVRLLIVKFGGSQKLYMDLQLCGGLAPLTPALFKGKLCEVLCPLWPGNSKHYFLELAGGRFKSGYLSVFLSFVPQYPVSEKTCRATSSSRNTARWFSETCGRGLESTIRISRWAAFATFASNVLHCAFCSVTSDAHFCHYE